MARVDRAKAASSRALSSTARIRTTLPALEREQGKCLFCVAKPQGDVIVEARDVRKAGDVVMKTLPCRIEHLDRVVDDVTIMRIKLPANERLQYSAGQYLEFLLKDGKRRSFSMANAPHDDALIELHIRHLPGGLFTDRVFGVQLDAHDRHIINHTIKMLDAAGERLHHDVACLANIARFDNHVALWLRYAE